MNCIQLVSNPYETTRNSFPQNYIVVWGRVSKVCSFSSSCCFHTFSALILSNAEHSSLICSFHHLTRFFLSLCLSPPFMPFSSYVVKSCFGHPYELCFPILYTMLSFITYILHLILHPVPPNHKRLQKLILTYLKYILCKQQAIFLICHMIVHVKGFHYHTI
jgi:hypothetical protein